MHLQMPRLAGIEATRRITSDPAVPARVLMLTTFDRDEHLYDAIRAGSSGFLLKSTPPEQLAGAVRIVTSGELLAPALTRRLLEQFAQRPLPGRATDGPLAVLTDREREVLAIVGRGFSNAEVATRLCLHPDRLGTAEPVKAVVTVCETGVVVPDEAG